MSGSPKATAPHGSPGSRSAPDHPDTQAVILWRSPLQVRPDTQALSPSSWAAPPAGIWPLLLAPQKTAVRYRTAPPDSCGALSAQPSISAPALADAPSASDAGQHR